ncbi:MAG TPA: ABC transporter ATP-binding protein [Solirubrobacteraceae bacterium]|jgi:iron(III) transport system ATP-binding protein|nr:ABC transporter ATP-binding protein [Solirubrobacteraceae bacterium]
MSAIALNGVCKRFGATQVLTDVDLTVTAGSITAVLGASGSGKTTMLRLIAGFEQLDAGTITIAGRLVDDGHRSVRPQQRGVGYVPQDGALFPHLTVIGNIGFGLARGDRAVASELLELVGLDGLERRYPHQLSGGQQQRVALARALAIAPSVVLLDEPFSSLDASLRAELGRDVARILNGAATTTVLVTHDQDEALALADQIAVLQDGRIVARDAPRALYRNPSDLLAATSIGEANILAAETHNDHAHCALGCVPLQANGRRELDGAVHLLLRPEQLTLCLQATDGATRATVLGLRYHGHDGLAHVVLDHPDRETVLARVPGELVLEQGQDVWVQASGPGRAWAMPEVTSEVIR